MIRIEIVNNGTGDTPEITGNYDYKVIDVDEKSEVETVLKIGVLTDVMTGIHGWVPLISVLDKDINGDRWKE